MNLHLLTDCIEYACQQNLSSMLIHYFESVQLNSLKQYSVVMVQETTQPQQHVYNPPCSAIPPIPEPSLIHYPLSIPLDSFHTLSLLLSNYENISDPSLYLFLSIKIHKKGKHQRRKDSLGEMKMKVTFKKENENSEIHFSMKGEYANKMDEDDSNQLQENIKVMIEKYDLY